MHRGLLKKMMENNSRSAVCSHQQQKYNETKFTVTSNINLVIAK